jgi:hypothetical protein
VPDVGQRSAGVPQTSVWPELIYTVPTSNRVLRAAAAGRHSDPVEDSPFGLRIIAACLADDGDHSWKAWGVQAGHEAWRNEADRAHALEAMRVVGLLPEVGDNAELKIQFRRVEAVSRGRDGRDGREQPQVLKAVEVVGVRSHDDFEPPWGWGPKSRLAAGWCSC